MRALIIEDEAIAADRLKQLLHKMDESIQVIAILESVEASVNWLLNQAAPELIFMDIQLDDGICFEIFESIEFDTPVIFTTAYDQYAIRAFKVNSVDYLLKPIELTALSAAIEKYRSLFSEKPAFNEKINLLYQQMFRHHKERFFVRSGAHFHSVTTKEISCFFIENRCTFFKTSSGKRYAIDSSLEQVQQKIDPARFFRVNRHYIVNIDAIADMTGYSSQRLKLQLKIPDAAELVVSRDRLQAFKEWLNR